MTAIEGFVEKMRIEHGEQTAQYSLILGENQEPLNQYLNHPIQLQFSGLIECIYCHRPIKKSYSQGYCFPCSQKLARCDYCILHPVRCHYHKGTCREPQWGETHCMIPHIVYLSVTSDIKIGITRKTQIPTRWFDQGATQAIPVFEVQTRRQSGYLEEVFKELLSDKTNWRTLLKQDNPVIDLPAKVSSLLPKAKKGIESVKMTFGEDAIAVLDSPEQFSCQYPVNQYPEKIKSHSFDKQPVIEGTLVGLKGQYLMLDTGVINMRKFTGYHVAFKA